MSASGPKSEPPPRGGDGTQGEVRSVRVELGSIPDLGDDSPPELPFEPVLPDVSYGPQPKPFRAADLPVLGPEHEVHDEEPPVREVHDEELPVLGPEYEVHDEELPVLGPEYEVHDEELPVLGPEYEVHDEELPVLGPEYEVHDEELPALGPEHAVTDAAVPELAPEHAVAGDAVPVLGLAFAIEEQALDELTVAASRPPPGERSEPDPDPELHQPESEPESDREAEVESDAEQAAHAEASRNYQQIYETELRPLERDARLALAQTADGSVLCALCLDADPQVIIAVLANSLSGLDHARLVARHHKNPVGLEAVVKRTELVKDTQVQRLLVRNPQLNDSLLRRVIGTKPLRELYKVCVDRDIPEKNRVASRGLLRTRWSSSSAEERANFVIATEARCLTFLIGQTFDSRMTSILCSRAYNSVLFIQNLARFPACPPALLVHLLKQPFVRKHATLKKILFQHPNVPSQAKRTL
ncbi:MAG: hypothetical protein IPI67_31780 [Myxococcales bacterium]|nr:hypothetical protein [Myxococcales bacterium]